MAAALTTEHEFYYNTDAPITAKALAETLLGLDGIVRRSAPIIARLLPGVATIDTEVLITKIELGSYKEDFFVRLIFGEGEAAEKKIEELREKLKLKGMDAKKIVAIAIAAALLYAGYQYVKPGDAAAIHIENSFNTLSAQAGATPADFRNLIEASLSGHKEDIKKQIVRLVHPDGTPAGGTITFDKDPALTIPADIIDRVPTEYEREERENPFKDFDNVTLTVRATDLDRPDQGWIAIIPDIDARRVPLSLSEGIKTDQVPSGKYIQADVTVIYQVDRKGNKTPKKYLLRKLHYASTATITAVGQPSPSTPSASGAMPPPASPLTPTVP